MPKSVAAAILALALLWPLLAAAPASARSRTKAAPPGVQALQPTGLSAARRTRRVLRIEVYPWWRYYRQCVDWYALEWRPSGPVIVPHMRCWWAVH